MGLTEENLSAGDLYSEGVLDRPESVGDIVRQLESVTTPVVLGS